MISLDRLAPDELNLSDSGDEGEKRRKNPHSNKLQKAITGGKGFEKQKQQVRAAIKASKAPPVVYMIQELEPERFRMFLKYILIPKIRKRHHLWKAEDLAENGTNGDLRRVNSQVSEAMASAG